MHPMSVMLLESFVLSKPYFDRNGLILALDDGKPVGFVHAGFGPTPHRDQLTTDIGTTCMLVVPEHAERERIQTELIQHSESYLRGKGAIELRAGGAYPHCPFYLGLYGGSELPGILSGDPEGSRCFRKAGYEEIERYQIFQRSITQFRPPVDRSMMQLRRQLKVRLLSDAKASSWWDACIFGPSDRIFFQLEAKRGGTPVGQVTFWDMGPLSTRFPSSAMGMIGLLIEEEHRGKGFETFLVSECLQHLAKSNISIVQAQTKSSDSTTQEMLGRLGFEELDYGVLFGK
ncbi:MAG: GNAT family N-acetyltransferase [Planctomycetaceae bacterium]|nr:GNAT family N-acetyltransferase [Planctomycetaceae bacterium]